jgi:hypothetical protein
LSGPGQFSTDEVPANCCLAVGRRAMSPHALSWQPPSPCNTSVPLKCYFHRGADRLWAVRIGDVEMHEPKLPLAALTSAPDGYEVCRTEARRLRAAGAVRLVTVSAALQAGEAAGFHVGTGGCGSSGCRSVRLHTTTAPGLSRYRLPAELVGLQEKCRYRFGNSVNT